MPADPAPSKRQRFKTPVPRSALREPGHEVPSSSLLSQG